MNKQKMLVGEAVEELDSDQLGEESLINGKRRRGRPVSIEVLKRRLAEAEQRAIIERDKRRAQVSEARDKAARAVAEKMEMRGELAAVRRELAKLTRQWKAEKREAERVAKMAAAWEDALAKFRMRWEKEYLIKEARSRRRGPGRPKKRGRPKGSRNKPKTDDMSPRVQ